MFGQPHFKHKNVDLSVIACLESLKFWILFFAKNYFFYDFRLFWCADIKNNFLKIKKILFWCIFRRKALWTATATIISNRPLGSLF